MKALLLSAALTAATLGAQAQVSFGIQPEAGLNLSSLRTTVAGEKNTTGTQANFHAGVALNIGLGEQLAIQPGVYYSVKGGTEENPLGGDDLEFKLDYVNIPVNVVYYFNNNQSGFFLMAGAYAAALVRARVKLGSAEESLSIGGDETKDDVRRWDIGFNGGAGYQLAMGLTLKAQYQLGAMNISAHNDSDNAIRTNNIAVSVGYRIGGK